MIPSCRWIIEPVAQIKDSPTWAIESRSNIIAIDPLPFPQGMSLSQCRRSEVMAEGWDWWSSSRWNSSQGYNDQASEWKPPHDATNHQSSRRDVKEVWWTLTNSIENSYGRLTKINAGGGGACRIYLLNFRGGQKVLGSEICVGWNNWIAKGMKLTDSSVKNSRWLRDRM